MSRTTGSDASRKAFQLLISHSIRLERKQTKTNTSRGLYMTGDFLKVMVKAKEVRDREHPTCP
jgi:hypothetical protein